MFRGSGDGGGDSDFALPLGQSTRMVLGHCTLAF